MPERQARNPERKSARITIAVTPTEFKTATRLAKVRGMDTSRLFRVMSLRTIVATVKRLSKQGAR